MFKHIKTSSIMVNSFPHYRATFLEFVIIYIFFTYSKVFNLFLLAIEMLFDS